MAQIHIADIPKRSTGIADIDNEKYKGLMKQRNNHTGNQWTKFIRTRNEIEHILGLGYDQNYHHYVDKMPEIEGLEVIFMRGNILSDGNKDGLGKAAYAVYLILLPYKEDEKSLITSDFLPDRYVILKSAIEDYLIHTDDEPHLRGNGNRAYALEFFLGQLGDGTYKIVMQQVDTYMKYFPCAEGNVPIELP